MTTASTTTIVEQPSFSSSDIGNHDAAAASVGIKTEELVDLLEYFAKTTYKAKDTQPKVQYIMQKCLDLFGVDYKYSVIPNTGGELSTNYPSMLIVLEEEKPPKRQQSPNSYLRNGLGYENGSPFREIRNSINTNGSCRNSSSASTCTLNGNDEKNMISSKLKINGSSSSCLIDSPDYCSVLNGNSALSHENGISELPKMKELCSKARFARCRARFPIPVILYNKKHICRSATLSGGPEIYGRSSFDYFFSGGTDSRLDCVSDDDMVLGEAQSEWQLFDRVRSQDIRLLKAFKVQTIIDLMVEKKKVKFGVNVTSSEKVDKENRYAQFNIVSLPYPGCEFFKQYRDNAYSGEQLVFEWNQGHVDANICVPSDPIAASLNLNWSQYRNWDLVVLTQNYLKLLLAYLNEGQKGILVHCISGWDRTPLFISLLRLSLWADGVIHKSLDADQILYLTLAYDWLLFGHNLEDRLSKGEEILFFCFNFLKYMVDPSFAVEEIKNLSSQFKISKVQSDSDIHVEGILLDGNITSPEGSNWSLNSCESSQSNISLSENFAPSYFQVSSQDSFEDCIGLSGATPVFQNGNGISSCSAAQRIAQNPILRTCANSTSCLITNSMINSVTLNGSFESCSNGLLTTNAHSPKNSQPLFVINDTSSSTIVDSVKSSNGIYVNKSLHGRTSPVPVPNHRLNQPRLESDSSASIGSWQLITGSGSLREITSASDPAGSILSNQQQQQHSYPVRLPLSELEYMEPSESSCTLVEELTPIQTNQSSLTLFTSIMKSSEITNGAATTGVDDAEFEEDDIDKENDELKYEFEIGLALADENFEGGKIDSDIDPLFSHPLNTLCLSVGGDIEPITLTSTPTEEDEETTPTHEENENNNHIIFSKRQERLESVRLKFYSLYSKAIGFQCRSSVSENGGLGSLIGNFASKVGIRSSSSSSSSTQHRISHV